MFFSSFFTKWYYNVNIKEILVPNSQPSKQWPFFCKVLSTGHTFRMMSLIILETRKLQLWRGNWLNCNIRGIRCQFPNLKLSHNFWEWPNGTPKENMSNITVIRSYSGPHFPAFRPNTERYGVSVCIRSYCQEIRTRITQNTDIFYAVNDSTFVAVLS